MTVPDDPTTAADALGDRAQGQGQDRAALAVVGTDTDVGKTVVTAALVARLRAAGRAVRAIKPVQTGADDDADFVTRTAPPVGAATSADHDSTAAAVTLFRYPEPLAPAVAAERAGEPLAYAPLLADCRAAMAAPPDGAIVEGVGGLRVPLAGDREVLDLVADLAVPALVVARPSLGTLNHTALTVDALRDRGVPVTGVVLSGYRGESVAERTNPGVLADMVSVPVRTLPWVDLASESPIAAVAMLARAIPDAVLPAGPVWP